MALDYNVLAWSTPWTEEPGGLWWWDHKGSGPIEATEYTHTHMIPKYFLNACHMNKRWISF